MELIEFKNKNKINFSKKLLNDILQEVRKELRKQGITFQSYIIGSGKHKMVFIPKNTENRSSISFDIDIQIIFQKFQNISIKKQRNLDYELLMEPFLNTLNKCMSLKKFQNSGDGRRVQKFYSENQIYDFKYEILSLIEKNEKDNNSKKQWYEIVKNSDNFILNLKDKYADSLKKFKTAIKNNKEKLKQEYKKLREEEFDKEIKRPNFQLLNLAIENINKPIKKIMKNENLRV